MATRNKIAVVIPKYGLVGGAEGFVAELTERIAQDEQYDIHVFANAWQPLSDRIIFHKIPVIRFPKFMTTPSFAYFAEKKIGKIPFDLIHTHDRIFRADLYTLHGIPHRVWIRDIRKKAFMSLFDRATAWTERRLVTNARRFLAVSELTRDIFLREYPMNADRVPVIHPGIEIRQWGKGEREIHRQEIRHRFGISQTDIVILFVSMNFDIKGLDAVTAALGTLCRRNPAAPCKLLVVGKGNESHYKNLAQRLGIADRVIFTGVVDRQALDHIYAAGDLYAMLSKFDTFGLVVLEAMAASLPVLISANVGAKDIVIEGVNGFVIADTADTTAIAARLEALFDGQTRTSMAEEALQTALRHTWEDTAAKVKALYAELLRERRH